MKSIHSHVYVLVREGISAEDVGVGLRRAPQFGKYDGAGLFQNRRFR